MKTIMMQSVFAAILLVSFCEINTLADGGIGATVLDQYHLANSESALFGVSGTTSKYQQEVTAGQAGILSTVAIRVFDPGTFDFSINLGSGWQSDANDFQTRVSTAARGWLSIDVSSANIRLQEGLRYVIGASGVGDPKRPYLTGSSDSWEAGYPGGMVWGTTSIGDIISFPSRDLAFETYVTLIPEPSVAALSLLGMTWFIGSRQRRR
jgi:hypothetical protein